MPQVSRLEVIATGARRRWTLAEKRRIVAESEAAPRQVSATARRYGLSPSHLFWWRRLARDGRLGATAPGVTFAEAVIACDGAKAASGPTNVQSRIEIVLRDGLRLLADPAVDAAGLARLVSALERRR
jgi:transposase